ncbi:unnamed protein product, partial [marine sediment metagenome]
VTGEITTNNGDGTYNVKINNASNAYKNVETRHPGAIFSIREIVDIGYEYGNKESPKILGSSGKVPQEPKQVEVDYSGGCAGGGLQTKTVTIHVGVASGSVGVNDTNYGICHDSVDGSDCEGRGLSTTIISLGQQEDGGTYAISKAYIYFDTSDIPDKATIIDAILSIAIADNYSINFNIVIQDGQPTYPHNPLIYSDYNHIRYSNNGGQIAAVAAEGPPIYSNIPLTVNGRNWINKGEMTKFCLRSSKDIASTIPSVGENNSVLIDKETYP